MHVYVVLFVANTIDIPPPRVDAPLLVPGYSANTELGGFIICILAYPPPPPLFVAFPPPPAPNSVNVILEV